MLRSQSEVAKGGAKAEMEEASMKMLERGRRAVPGLDGMLCYPQGRQALPRAMIGDRKNLGYGKSGVQAHQATD